MGTRTEKSEATIVLYETKDHKQEWCQYFGGDEEANSEGKIYKSNGDKEVLRFRVKEVVKTQLEIIT